MQSLKVKITPVKRFVWDSITFLKLNNLCSHPYLTTALTSHTNKLFSTESLMF